MGHYASEMDGSPGPSHGPATPAPKRSLMPHWQKRQLANIVKCLSEWRNQDHEDAIEICRSDVICLLDALTALRDQLQDAETGLSAWDEHRDSEYWVRYPERELSADKP